MDFTNRMVAWTGVRQTILSAVLLIGVGLTAVGCDSNGSSGSDSEGLQLPESLNLEATPANGSVSLNWDSVEGAETYRVYRSKDADVNVPASPLDAGISNSTYTDNTTENGTTYYYAVTAVGSKNVNDTETAPSRVVQGTPFANATGLEGTSGDAEVELTWEPASGAETYNVYRSESKGVDVSGSPLTSGVSSSSYTDASVTNGTTYYYRITAVRSGEESDASSEIAKTPVSEPPSRP